LSGQLRLRPLPPRCLGAAFPWSQPGLIELHAIFGGVPGYLARLDPQLDLLQNLERHLLTPGEPLYHELPFLLREELRDPRVYFALLSVIARGARRFGEISSKVGLDRADLSRYLATLIELGLVEREVPVTEPRPDKSSRGLYRIDDAFTATWFSFVHPQRSLLERGRIDEALETGIRPRGSTWLGQAVEPVVRELFVDGPWAPLVPFPVAWSGRHWSRHCELDLVLLDAERRRAFVGEIKWSQRPVRMGLLDNLKRRVEGERAFEGMEVTACLVSRQGFGEERELWRDERVVNVAETAIAED